MGFGIIACLKNIHRLKQTLTPVLSCSTWNITVENLAKVSNCHPDHDIIGCFLTFAKVPAINLFLPENKKIVPRGTINFYFFFKFPRIFRLKGVME